MPEGGTALYCVLCHCERVERAWQSLRPPHSTSFHSVSLAVTVQGVTARSDVRNDVAVSETATLHYHYARGDKWGCFVLLPSARGDNVWRLRFVLCVVTVENMLHKIRAAAGRVLVKGIKVKAIFPKYPKIPEMILRCFPGLLSSNCP